MKRAVNFEVELRQLKNLYYYLDSLKLTGFGASVTVSIFRLVICKQNMLNLVSIIINIFRLRLYFFTCNVSREASDQTRLHERVPGISEVLAGCTKLLLIAFHLK